jgi:S-formylglutathione hydrolase
MGGHGALTIGLSNPDTYQSISAFAPIVAPSQCPWGEKALDGYLGDDRETWQKHDATELVRAGARHPQTLLIDQGTADDFLAEQLKLEGAFNTWRDVRLLPHRLVAHGCLGNEL